MVSDAHKRANEKWKREKTVRYSFRLAKTVDSDLIDFMETVDNKQGLIKRLLREEMNKGKEEHMKHYGNENTTLKLTGKALANYSDADPLDIYEYQTENGLRYKTTGIIECDDLTEADLIETLEQL